MSSCLHESRKICTSGSTRAERVGLMAAPALPLYWLFHTAEQVAIGERRGIFFNPLLLGNLIGHSNPSNPLSIVAAASWISRIQQIKIRQIRSVW